MAQFTVRVELRGATESDVAVLNTEMEKRRFSRTIAPAHAGKRYRLPAGEYDFTGEATAQGVMDLAKSAAAVTGRVYTVLVTEVGHRTWYNLPIA